MVVAQPNQAGLSRRAQILQCTIDALAEVGYSRTSVGEIARRGGISKGVVTYHFPDKTALLSQVVFDLYRSAGEQIEARVEAAENSRAALRGYLEANLDFLAAHARPVQAAVEVMANLRRDDGTPAFTPGATDPVTEHLAELLRTGQLAGQFGGFDCRSVALILRAAIDTAAGRLISDPSFDLPTYRHELIELADRATTPPDDR